MEYKLYTLVDITHTGQHRNEPGKESLRWKEQNFQTVIQTLGIRSNISYTNTPIASEVNGRLVGFNTDKIIRVWRFDFSTDREHVYELNDNPVGALIEDFTLVPYISGLDEAMIQKYAVFNPEDPGKNIAFFKK